MVVKQLCCADAGDYCKIIKIEGEIRGRLSELGFNNNQIVKVVNHNGKNGPINIQIRDYNLALRHNEAECIEVEIIPRNS